MSQIKELVRKYGRTALAVHFGLYGVSLAGIYTALKANVDVTGLLKDAGLLANKDEVQLDVDGNPIDHKPSWFEEKLSSFLESGGTLAVAFVCNKALMPVRGTITVATTPYIARMVQRMRGAGGPASSKPPSGS